MPRNSSRAVNPPPYFDNIPGHWEYTPSTHTNNHGDNERNALLSQQSNTYGPSVTTSPKLSCGILNAKSFFILLWIGLGITILVLHPKSHDSIRREWDAEERRHQAMRNDWNMERDGWNSERNAIVAERGAWQRERAAHNLERETWREEWRKEREEHENWQRQDEEEKRALIVWEDLKPSSRCLRYGTREYSATLAHVASGLDPLKECWNKSIDIHGQQMFPSRCDTRGICGTVTGHWVVDFNEATCVTWWAGYDDKGCVQERGIHRYESILMNLQNGDDWHEMCATTPGRVQGRHFDGPTSCASWRSGINAIWLVEDENCY